MAEDKVIKVDLGCGKRKKEGFIGVDPDPNSEADIVASALDIPLEDGTVDEVFSVHVLEHFDMGEAKQFFSEIYRILKKGGKAYVRGDTDWTKKRLLKKDPTHKHRYSVKEVKAILEPIGFARTKVQKKIYRAGWRIRIFNQIFIWLVK